MKDKNNNSDGFFSKIGKGDKSKEVYFGIDFRNNLEKDTKPNQKPIVTWVDQSSPSRNKIFKDDIILSVNGNIVKNVKDFFLERSKLKPGDKSSLIIKRSKKKNYTHNKSNIP